MPSGSWIASPATCRRTRQSLANSSSNRRPLQQHVVDLPAAPVGVGLLEHPEAGSVVPLPSTRLPELFVLDHSAAKRAESGQDKLNFPRKARWKGGGNPSAAKWNVALRRCKGQKKSRCNSFGVAQSPEKLQTGRCSLYLKALSCQAKMRLCRHQATAEALGYGKLVAAKKVKGEPLADRIRRARSLERRLTRSNSATTRFSLPTAFSSSRTVRPASPATFSPAPPLAHQLLIS